jgi:glycosyltransferase involved in cell wall biosynthesis
MICENVQQREGFATLTMLCISTPNPDSLPETYVRQHIRSVMPGKTVVLYFQGNGESVKDVPSLHVRDAQGINKLAGYFRSLSNAIKYAYPGAIVGRTEEAVEEFLLQHKVGYMLAEFGPTGCALLPLCRKLGIRLVVNFHGHDATVMPKRWVIRNAYKYLNKHADAFVCGSRHFSEVLIKLGFDRKKIHVIPCGIELDQFHPGVEKDANLILAIGRLVEKKAPHLTIQAFIKVLKKCPNARLEMIGDGPFMNMCREVIQNNNLEEKIILHGAQSHEFVKQKLESASLFVQHSVVASNGDTESQGISLLEAMASEIPVVSTRHNGFVETVIDGLTGFLITERDVTAMADRMVQVLQDNELREKMGKAGRKRVKEYFDADMQTVRLKKLLILD